MIRISAAPLPTNFRGTPQQLLEAFLDRVEIASDSLGFVISDNQPSGNEGVWLKNGKQINVWDEATSTYVPLDVSASVSEQIFVGETEPDPEKYDLWFKTAGTIVVGLFKHMGSELGWAKQAAELGNAVITTAMLQNDSVTADKIANGSITSAKLANDLPLAKIERGVARTILRMKSDGSEPEWAPLVQESTELPISYSAVTEVSHGLNAKPGWYDIRVICKEAEGGWAVGDEWSIFPALDWSDSDNASSTVFVNDTKIGIVMSSINIRGRHRSTFGQFVITPAKWKIKFLWSAK